MLRPETETVWNFIKQQVSLRDFILIGGTALTLRISHRISEDLDLCHIGSKLPRKALDIFLATTTKNGFSVERTDDPAASDEFEIAGMELLDFQQDFLVNETVKLSFFIADSPLENVLGEVKAGAQPSPTPRIADLDELFRSKAIVSSKRSKTRDWFDLYFLLKYHGYTIDDYRNAFSHAGIPNQWELGLSRICSGKPQANDEGYEELIDNPPSLEEISSYFRKLRNDIEIRLAEESRRRLKNP